MVTVLGAAYLTSLLVLAQNSNAFRPDERSLHVFPSVVKSDTWHNVATLGVHDLSEHALFADFNTENSAYIDPTGVLPSDVDTEVQQEEPDATPASPAATSSDAPTTTTTSTSSTSGALDDSATTSTNTDAIDTIPTSTEPEPSAPAGSETDASTEDEPTGSDDDTAEGEPEPSEAEQPEEDTSEQPLEEEALLESLLPDGGRIIAFFKRVTGNYRFTQAVTTTPTTTPDQPSSDATTTAADLLATTSESTGSPPATSTTADEGTVDATEAGTSTATATQQNVTGPEEEDADSDADESTPENEVPSHTPEHEYTITLADFGVPDLESGQFINNLQLRLSLAGQYDIDASSSAPALSASYSFGDFSGESGGVLIEEENSNAINGGYYLIPLPSVSDPSLLSDLSITLTFTGELERLGSLYVDAAWLEVGTIVYDTKQLKQRSSPAQLKHLAVPDSMEYLGDRLDFGRYEVPRFSLRYNSQRNFMVRGMRSVLGRDLVEVRNVRVLHGGVDPVAVSPDITVTDDGLITILLSEEDKAKMKPGKYTVEIEVDEGGYVSTDSFDFQWGILTINSDQTEYEMGEVAEFSMGALSPNGNTLCNANLDLYIIDPRGFISKEPVTRSGQCKGNNVVDVPDYSAQFVTGVDGEYEMYLERLDDSGNVIGHTSDTFMVVGNQSLAIERNGPTRIYPPSPYAMELTVHAKQASFSGQLIERVPRGFDVFNTDADVHRYADFTELVWDVSMLASSSRTVSYEFDAPDLSPYLYELGPARLERTGDASITGSATTSATTTGTESDADDVFTEHRQWQIASDAVGNMILFWDDGAAIPPDWACLSCGSGTFYQRFVMGSSTYNSTGGNTTHGHTADGTVLSSSDSATESGSGGIAPVGHTHTYAPTISTESNMPEYRQLRVIQYTGGAGEPATIPAGAIGVFDVASSSLPAGWNRYAVQDARYIYGEDTPGTTGGANSHSHTISGTTGASSGAGTNNRGGPSTTDGATDTHTHDVGSSTAAGSNEPPYVEVLLAELTSDAAPPNSLIAMWTEDVPSGWLDISSAPGDAFNNRFLKPAAAYGATGGNSVHAHADVTGILSSGPSAVVTGRTGSAGGDDLHTHDVNIENFSTTSHMPPYVTAVFGKRQGVNPVYDQNASRWYVNEDDQTPTDPWPPGGTDLLENQPISATATPVKNGEVVRLRMNVGVTNATSTAGSAFQLQYATSTACSAASNWQPVGDTASSTAWRGYNNGSVSDHSTLTSTLLSSSTVAETYAENGYATATPNAIAVGAFGEWDFVLEQNGAEPGTTYCFRLVESDGSAFLSYSQYPKLVTNEAPDASSLQKLFDNEKTPSTTPAFDFVATDAEGEDIHYQIQIDDDHDFGSAAVDRDTLSDSTQFENQVFTADKAPFNQGELIRFTTETTLTNGTTYYWRVRAQDPDGANAWGDWSTIRSFTTDTSLTASAWFQTEDAQFDTNTFIDVSTGSDEVTLAGAAATGTMISTPIDFTDGDLGTAWDSLIFTDTETAGDVVYHIEYLTDAASWERIPDSDLAGNATGFDTSPVSLLNLDVEKYDTIRLVADLTDAGGSPSVQDWTVNWGYRVETPTISQLFPNEKTGTTTPTFAFTTGDPQNNDLTYQLSWSTDNTFTSSTTRTSDTDTGFVNTVVGGDTDPFNSGDTIQFTVQGADALSNNTTYWWRVRAKDTTGANAYSFWTSPQSFTVDATVNVSTWFQTTEEQFNTNILSGTVALASDALTVATTASEALIIYGEGTETVPRYRQWDGSAWGDEGEMLDINAPLRWSVVRAGTTREEYVAAIAGTDSDINVQVFSTGEWENALELTTSMGDATARGFDVAYETVSGDALVAYCDGDSNPSYRVWNGSSWSAESAITTNSTGDCRWIEMDADPTSDEIIVVIRDASGSEYEAQVWNGTSWGNAATFGQSRDATFSGISVSYEDSGDEAVIAVPSPGGGPNRMVYNVWDGTTWSGETTQTIDGRLFWGDIARNVGTDDMTLCYLNDNSDVQAIRWTGAGWTDDTEFTATANADTDPAFACIYETTGGRENFTLGTYSDTAAASYRVWDTATWSGETQVNAIGDSATMQLIRTGSGDILGAFFDDPNDSLRFTTWDGSGWSTTETIEDDMSVDSSPFGHPYAMAPRNSGSEGTTIVAPGIDFDDGTGPYWQEMRWVDSTPGSSDILYSVQYFDAASSSWKFIPDSDLPENGAGTSTSPIDLFDLDVNTYDAIRPHASLSCDGGGTCPQLQDWTVTWAEGITVSGTLQAYDQSTNINSGTVAVAVNGVLQTGKTGSVSGGSWSIGNVTTFPGDVVTVFIDGAGNANEAVGVTRYDGSGNITGLQLFERHLTLGSDDATSTPLSNADVSLYDVTNDEDVFIGGSGSTLTLCADAGCTDAELHIHPNAVFAPGGTVVAHDIENNGTLQATGTLSVSGSWDNNATATLANSAVIFAATSTVETVDSTGASVSAFNDVTFGTTTGTATWTLATALDVDGDLTTARGTLARGTEPVTVAGDLTNGTSGVWTGIGTTTLDGNGTANWADQNPVLQNIGNAVIDGAAKTVVLSGDVAAESITIGANDILDVSGADHDVTVYGDWTNNNTFTARGGEVFFSATTSNTEITTGGSTFFDLTFNGGGDWAFTESTLTVGGDLTIAAGTLAMPTATTTLGGSFSSVGGTFMHNNSLVHFTSLGAETIAASGTAFTNAFYDLRFDGSGSWTFTDAHATTSNDLIVDQGTVTFPSGTLAFGGSLRDSGGAWNANNGTVRFTGAGAETIQTGGSALNDLVFAGNALSFTDADATVVGDMTMLSGINTLPSGTLTLGGSFVNNATLDANGGTILFDSTDTGAVIDAGGYDLHNVTFDSASGGWTVQSSATATNDVSITNAADLTLASGEVLSVGGVFTNSVGSASTTWTGSTLSLESGSYSINSKDGPGDQYAELRIGAASDISIWHSSAATVNVLSGGSLYSQDHAGVDGDLYIYGDYTRANGAEYWSYATDFDGTDLATTSSERQARVYLAAGASAALADSTMEILGTPGASTTVANQGSGTYTLSIDGGTTTAQYYAFDDLGSSGVSLLGSTTVTSLRDGAFTVGENAGTALTLSSTTIDANPAKQVFNVVFATTTAISATNVTQSDGTPASNWWFRESSGNLAGEAFDADTGDPGSVRWDDSSLVLTISGTVYTDDGNSPLAGGTCDGVATPVRVVVENGATYDGSCSNADGTFSIGGVVAIGDPTITVFLNDASGGEEAVTVTKTPTADVTDLDLYANRVIVRHEDTDPLTIADMAALDAGDDPDIFFTAATGTADTLSVQADRALHVWASSTFTPNGSVTLHADATGNTYDGMLSIGSDATFTGAGTTTYSIGGSIDVATGGAFLPASSAVIMRATTTGKTINAAAGETITFNALRFTGAGGGWNINGNVSASSDIEVATGTVTGTGDITLINGELYGDGLVSLGGGTTTIHRTNTLGGTRGWTFYDLTLGSGSDLGTTTPASTATTTILGRLTIANAHFLDAGSAVIDLAGTGTVFSEDGTFLEDTSTVRYSAAGAADIFATDYYNLVLEAGGGSPTYIADGPGLQVRNDMTVGIGSNTTADFDTNDPALNIDGDLTVGTQGTFIASDGGAFTLAGDYANMGTFTGSGGTLTFDGSGAQSIAAGASPFSSVDIAASGDVTVSEHATATDGWALTSANAFTVAGGASLAVGGAFTNDIGGAATTWTDSTLHLFGGGNHTINASTSADTYGALSVAANTQIRMWNSDAAATDVAASGSIYSMDHAGVDGELHIYGDYVQTSGTDHWSYATDFDSTGLTGGSERQAAIHITDGSTVTYSGSGSLAAFGAPAASTTIQNQGSGRYALTVGDGASTTLAHYVIRDIDADGLTFTGAPAVTSIADGDLLVANDAETAITIGGTAIDANPARTFSRILFATSSGVSSATNVTATGTSVSSWRFTNHYGSIDGEAFDSDPDGDPGYIVWDDSAASISISGVIYSDEGTTVSGICDGSTQNVHVRVAGLTSYTTSCDGGSGAYSVSGVTYSPGDSIIVYIDGESQAGAAVTADPISNISNMDVYESRVIVRHENTDPLTITDMAAWDSADDADVPFTAVAGSPDTLTLPADRKLIVWQGKEFAPGGNVTLSGGGGGAAHDGTLELYANAEWTSAVGESHAIGGSLISGAGATFDAASAAFTFTTDGAARSIDTNDAPFADVTFNGTGSWTIDNSTLAADDVTITAGAVTLPAATTTVSGSLENTGGSFDANNGVMVFAATGAETIRASSSAFATLTITGSGAFSMQDTHATATASVTVENGTLALPSGTFAVGGDFQNTGGSVTHNTAELILTNPTSATLRASSSDLSAVTLRGGGAYEMADADLTLLDSLTISAGTATLASGTLAIGGSFDASGGSFDHATGTILFNSSDTGEIIDPGTSDFHHVSIAGPTGGWTINGSATTSGNFTLSSASDFTLGSGNTLTVAGVFTNAVGGAATTWTGSTLRLLSGSEYALNTKAAGGDAYETLIIGPNTDIAAWNTQATTTTVDQSASFYSQDHAGVDGDLYIYGDYHIATTTEYWSYATDFDGTDLSGGSERAVLVRHAASATTTVDGGTLNIVGGSGNETTITVQGGGTYAFGVADGTFNASQYAFRDLNAAGLELSGSPSITTLDQGDLELAVDGGNLITLSSTTLNANASLVISGVRFATSSAITGTNIERVGTTTSAWTFTGHTGNLDGESFDVDGGSACGQIRWDDSSCLLTQQTHYRWRSDDGGIDVPDSEWYDQDWSARKRVRIENADDAAYTDAAVELTVIFDADMQSDFDDLRFTDDSGTTSIPYFIASSTNGETAEVWVKVPTIPADDTATVFMYYGNGSATSTSAAGDVFIAADDFEDGDISEYAGDTGLFAVDGSFAYGGAFGLDNTGNENAKATDGIARFDQTVSQGEIIRFQQFIDTNDGSGDEVCTLFGMQSPVTANQNYAVCLEQFGTDRISLARDAVNTDSSGTILATSTVTYETGWYTVEVDWQDNDAIGVSLYDDSGTLVATTSASDGTYTSGGYGFTYWFNHGGWDNYTSRPRTDTEPTIRFGVEQGDGGASWAAPQDTPATDMSLGETARVRFAVENTGLSVTDAYQLEYAEQGAAPSCEAVSSGNFSAVAPISSCGSDPVCMATSTSVANGANTTDLLMDTSGDFVPGRFIEDPSNTTASIDVDQEEYTEVEYSVTVNSNVTDQNLCFRVTDNGSDLDTYLRVAKMEVPFEPSFGPVSFNLGQDISLTPGTTTRVYATSTVTDLNGYDDLVTGSTTLYTTTAGAACTPDNNNCYVVADAPQCTFTDCAGSSCVLECYTDMYFHADPTDADGGTEWFAFMEAEDQEGSADFATSPGIEVLTLRALNVGEAINYGALEVDQDTGAQNATTTIENQGNDPIDVEIIGDDLTDGSASIIPANQQVFATTTFNYSACTFCTTLSTSSITYELDLSKPTTTSPGVTDDIYWGIAVPFGTASNPHTGVNTFYAIGD